MKHSSYLIKDSDNNTVTYIPESAYNEPEMNLPVVFKKALPWWHFLWF
jgi:hypothetical protein